MDDRFCRPAMRLNFRKAAVRAVVVSERVVMVVGSALAASIAFTLMLAALAWVWVLWLFVEDLADL